MLLVQSLLSSQLSLVREMMPLLLARSNKQIRLGEIAVGEGIREWEVTIGS